MVAVDLPAGDTEAGLAAYADAIVAAAGGASDVVLVAQSMGGVLGAAGRRPARRTPARAGQRDGAEPRRDLQRVVGRGGPAEPPARTPRRTGRDPDAPFDVDEMFFHDVPPEVTAEAMTPRRAAAGGQALRGALAAGRVAGRADHARSPAATTGCSPRRSSAPTCRTGSASSPRSSTAATWWRCRTRRGWRQHCSTTWTDPGGHEWLHPRNRSGEDVATSLDVRRTDVARLAQRRGSKASPRPEGTQP